MMIMMYHIMNIMIDIIVIKMIKMIWIQIILK